MQADWYLHYWHHCLQQQTLDWCDSLIELYWTDRNRRYHVSCVELKNVLKVKSRFMYIFLVLQTQNMFVPKMLYMRSVTHTWTTLYMYRNYFKSHTLTTQLMPAQKHITSYDTMKMRTHQRNYTSHNSLQGNNSFQDESKITIDIMWYLTHSMKEHTACAAICWYKMVGTNYWKGH